MNSSLPLSLFALAGAISLSSCSSPRAANGPGDGRTLFLGDFRRPEAPGSQTAELKPSNAADNSYWDGDGVAGAPAIKIDLSDQAAYFYRGGKLVGKSAVSSGNSAHRTPTGSFRITEKDIDHVSNLYGTIVDADGNVVKRDADSRTDKVPPGGKFVGAPMPNFMRFNRGVGMHAGYLPGYPASHGCVRMPDYMSAHFYNNVRIGTPVSVVP